MQLRPGLLYNLLTGDVVRRGLLRDSLDRMVEWGNSDRNK
jgi:hypothetical protein